MKEVNYKITTILFIIKIIILKKFINNVIDMFESSLDGNNKT